jgi:hypothetical protein
MMPRRWLLLCIGALGMLLLVSTVQARPPAAPSADSYELTWATWDGGGGTVSSADGVYTLAATAGQYDAGSPINGYTLDGGFWYGADLHRSIFLPITVR